MFPFCLRFPLRFLGLIIEPIVFHFYAPNYQAAQMRAIIFSWSSNSRERSEYVAPL